MLTYRAKPLNLSPTHGPAMKYFVIQMVPKCQRVTRQCNMLGKNHAGISAWRAEQTLKSRPDVPHSMASRKNIECEASLIYFFID